ncbi:MAG: CPXCG motif-containing cysteine-rich protein [Arenicellaceae bacterium]|nr:CPXCG motif-containing cysteine-rich protein [Arenicellaceae bacterium]
MLEETSLPCPYCGEPLNLLIDISTGDQNYVEDCQVCCRPIEFSLCTWRENGNIKYQLGLKTDND